MKFVRPLFLFLLGTLLAHATHAAPESPLPLATFRRLQAGEKQTVIVYGTSLTAIGEWPNAARRYFETTFPNQVTFINAARSGMTSVWGIENLQARVLDPHPDLVFIEFSANDAATKHHIPVETSRANLDHMVQALRAQNPQVEIVIETMNPAWDAPGEKNLKTYGSDRPHLPAYYAAYRDYAREQGLPLLDHFSAWEKLRHDDLKKFEQWVPDGIHPNPEGSLAITWTATEAFLEKTRAAAKPSAPPSRPATPAARHSR